MNRAPARPVAPQGYDPARAKLLAECCAWVYMLQDLNLPPPVVSSSSGSGSGGTHGGTSSSGGGSFPLILDFLLLGLAACRKRMKRA